MRRKPAIPALALACAVVAFRAPAAERVMGIAEFRDKLEGGWIGQMAGVAWGEVTEGGYVGRTIPEGEIPVWSPALLNRAFDQDDVYVEIPFMESMRRHGVNASWTRFGEAFKTTQFPLWVANGKARDNLRAGIVSPWSGHPTRNEFFEAIDWQIESNFAGLVAPGMVRAASDVAFRGGHVTNYADGVWGGVSFAAMTAKAYTATSLNEIIEVGRQSVPVGTSYRQLIDDVIGWHAADIDKGTWEDTWQKIEDKWGKNQTWVAARANGAFVFMGLVYGDGDFEKSMKISMQGGRDSDCNPSSVGGILGAYYGAAAIPDKWKSALDRSRNWSFTELSYDESIELSVDLARDVLKMRGGTVTGAGAAETWTIPDDGGVLAPIAETWPWYESSLPNLAAQVVSVDGLTVTLSASATDPEGISAYQWFFGDLSYSTASPGSANVSHTYGTPGNYEILAYAADGPGITSWRSLRVQVLPEGAVRGDADFDGFISADDYWRIDAGFIARASGYSRGDFDGDGDIDVDDYAVIDAAMLAQASGQPAVTPEPGAAAIVGLLALSLGRRANRRRASFVR